jgi:hypothetical protein
MIIGEEGWTMTYRLQPTQAENSNPAFISLGPSLRCGGGIPDVAEHLFIEIGRGMSFTGV